MSEFYCGEKKGECIYLEELAKKREKLRELRSIGAESEEDKLVLDIAMAALRMAVADSQADVNNLEYWNEYRRRNNGSTMPDVNLGAGVWLTLAELKLESTPVNEPTCKAVPPNCFGDGSHQGLACERCDWDTACDETYKELERHCADEHEEEVNA